MDPPLSSSSIPSFGSPEKKTSSVGRTISSVGRTMTSSSRRRKRSIRTISHSNSSILSISWYKIMCLCLVVYSAVFILKTPSNLVIRRTKDNDNGELRSFGIPSDAMLRKLKNQMETLESQLQKVKVEKDAQIQQLEVENMNLRQRLATGRNSIKKETDSTTTSATVMQQQQNRPPFSSSSTISSASATREADRLVARVLNGDESLTDTNLQKEIKFTPGTLDLSIRDVLGHCYTNTTIYEKHLSGFTRLMSVSSKNFGIIYAMVPKSGSSTGRFMMEKRFGGKVEFRDTQHLGTMRRRTTTTTKPTTTKNNDTIITFLRDPLSRFFAGYDEAYSRTGPWFAGQSWGIQGPHPYPYLHKGLKTWSDYEDVWCPTSTRGGKSAKDACTFAKTLENGTLAERLNQYVEETDGRSPFDEHLRLQVPFLSNAKTGLVYHLDEIYETKDTKSAWEDIALRHNVDLSIPIQKEWNILESELTGVIQGRSFPRRFDMSKVTNQTKQRVCEHSLLDYCCLNMPLPPPCQDLYCKLSYGTGEDNQQRRLQIQPWTFPTSSSKEVSDSRV